jgi:hypothetical protein
MHPIKASDQVIRAMTFPEMKRIPVGNREMAILGVSMVLTGTLVKHLNGVDHVGWF